MRVSPTLAATTEGLNLSPPLPTVMGILAARLRGRREKSAVARERCIMVSGLWRMKKSRMYFESREDLDATVNTLKSEGGESIA